jgi:hypothetical protein
MTITVVTIFFVFILTGTAGRILLYHTENDQTVEKFDCVYHVHNDGEDTPYCRRLFDDKPLNRTEIMCYNGGSLVSFRDLIIRNISPDNVLEWSSSIEKADLYARFFYNQSSIEDTDETFLCNCTQPGTFGKYCEYQLTHDTKLFSDAIKAQFEQKKNGDSWLTQIYGSILCYETLMCDSGLMCLDWRDINDGIQQCRNGLDEENWDKLEFNECEDNEFRCTNGMCIPEEFWLDGEYSRNFSSIKLIVFKDHPDCMDWSDELNQESGESCSFTPNTMECDEHLCSRNKFSCGDGQCIEWGTRMAFQRFLPALDNCFNKRNLNHMCEVSPHQRAWTLPNGLCWSYRDYDDPRYPPWNKINGSKLSNGEKCQYLLRCALSEGLESDCPCDHTNCSQLMMNICPDSSIIIYPSGKLINPNVLVYYDYSKLGHNQEIAALVFHGNLRCRGYQLTIEEPISIPLSIQAVLYNNINDMMCMYISTDEYKNYSSPNQYDEFCYNDSFTFNGRPYAVNPDICTSAGECISQYRINDGSRDCVNEGDEISNLNKNYCTGNVGRHRFQCYNNENKCLTLASLNSTEYECSNGYDEFWYGRNSFLKSHITCQKSAPTDCARLKEYIGQSSIKNESLLVRPQPENKIDQISFRSYCDSFWNLQDHRDERADLCQHWVCQKDQFQCLTGQCIELDWVCDGEWDCADASDEEAILLIRHWSAHNSQFNLSNSVLSTCQARYSALPFSTICNTSHEFPCYRSGVSNPLDIYINRPCINLNKIGDGIEDCYNAYDEKNTFETHPNSGKMLGFHLRCGNHSEPYISACRSEAKNDCSEILCSNHRFENNSCSGVNDVICLNGQCAKHGRCNGRFDCSYGEDEYWCPHIPSLSPLSRIEYRYGKKSINRGHFSYDIPRFPPQKASMNRQNQLEKPVVNSRNGDVPLVYSYLCNQGVVVLQLDKIICLCPPAYYGDRCQFFSDRISIIAQIDPKTSLKSPLKIRAKFIFYDTIIDEHEFIINPTIENLNQIKHKFYLLYSRSNEMLTHKRSRFFNRSDIVMNHPYSVHFDAFSLEKDHSVKELGSWHYPIYFDYLPAYRFAVVLKFPDWFFSNTGDVCSQNSCNENSVCMPIFNQNNRYYCSCKSGFHGKDCSIYDCLCDTYCSPNALCRSGAHQLKSNVRKPYCICPLNHFGPRCNLEHHECDSSPCLNNGTCFNTDDRSGEASYICRCSKQFHGNRCQYPMRSAHVDLSMTNIAAIQAAVVQFYDIDASFSELLLQHQQVYRSLPSRIDYYHSDVHVPSLGLLKIYKNFSSTQYFIVYHWTSTTIINITSIPQHCPHASSLLLESKFQHCI